MTLARICTLPGLNWGRGRLRERWGTRLPHPPRHAESDGKRLSRVPQRRLSTQPNTRWSPAQTHEVRRLPPRFIRGGSPLPGPRPARPPPLSVLKQKEKTEGQGAAVPGDFTLFEASVFRRCRCHPRFSLLLHRHLPPSPAGRAGEPGKGVAACWGLLRAGSRFPEAAAREGAEPPARPRAAQPGRRSLPGPLPVLLSAKPRGVPACRHFGGSHWRQNADGAAPPRVTHSYSQRCSLTRMRIARSRKWRAQRQPPGGVAREGCGSSLPGPVTQWGRLQWRSWGLLTGWPPLVVKAIPTFLTKLPICLNTDGNPLQNVLGYH